MKYLNFLTQCCLVFFFAAVFSFAARPCNRISWINGADERIVSDEVARIGLLAISGSCAAFVAYRAIADVTEETQES